MFEAVARKWKFALGEQLYENALRDSVLAKVFHSRYLTASKLCPAGFVCVRLLSRQLKVVFLLSGVSIRVVPKAIYL